MKNPLSDPNYSGKKNVQTRKFITFSVKMPSCMSCFCRQFEINKNNRKTSVYKNRSEYLNVISKLNHVNQFIGRMST